MSNRTKRLLWWCAVVVLALAAGALAWVWRSTQGLMTTSEAAFIERVAKAAKEGTGGLEKSELNPLIRQVTAWVAGNFPQEISDTVSLFNAASVALLVGLFALLLRRYLPWWLALAGPAVWITLPLSLGQSGLGGAGWSSALFLVGPGMLLTMGMGLDCVWKRSLAAGTVGLLAGVGILAHPLAAWTALCLVLTLFLTRSRDKSQPGLVSLPPFGAELLALLVALAAGFMLVKGLLHANGRGLLAFLFGFLDGPHPAVAVLGSVYRGGEQGGPPWYTTLVSLLFRTPPEWLLLGLLGAFLWVRASHQGRPVPRFAWPFWGSLLVLLGAATLNGSPLIPAGLHLLVPISLGFTFLACWGVDRGWEWVTNQSRLWQRVGQVSLALLLASALIHGLVASFALAPMPQAYANGLVQGPQAFLRSGNDPLAEMAIPNQTLNRLSEEGLNELLVSPSSKAAQRLLQAFEPTRKFKVREGGTLPLLFIYTPSSPRNQLQTRLLEGREAKWAYPVAGVDFWSLYPR